MADETRLEQSRARMESARMSLEIRKSTLKSVRESAGGDPAADPDEKPRNKGKGIFMAIVGGILGVIFFAVGSFIWGCICLGIGVGGIFLEVLTRKGEDTHNEELEIYEKSVQVAQEFYDRCKADYESLLKEENDRS